MLEEDLASLEWNYAPDVVVFDHQVHNYTVHEVRDRLVSYIGKQARYKQWCPGARRSCQGRMFYEGSNRFILRGPTGHVVDLTDQLTDPRDECGKERGTQTILEFNMDEEREASIRHDTVPGGIPTETH